MNNKKNHPHFYTIIFYFFKYLFILALPTVQLLIFNPKGFIEKILSAGYGILWVILFLAVIITNYKCTRYYYGKSFFIEKGVFIKRFIQIPNRKIHSLSLKETLTSGVFGSVNFEIDTIARKNSIDVNLFFKNKTAKCIIKDLLEPKRKKYFIKANIFKIVLVSILWANPITIILVAIPFIKQTGKILGKEVSRRLYTGLNMTFYLISIGISPVIAGFVFTALALFTLTVLINFFKYSNFKTTFLEDRIIINRGVFSKISNVINVKNINAIVFLQNPFMRILNKHNLYINVVSSESDKDEKILMLILESKKKLNLIINLILGDIYACTKSLKATKKSKKSFIMFPLLCTITTIIIFFIVRKDVWYNEIIKLALVFAIVFEVYWILFRLLAHKKTSLCLCESFNEKILIVSGFKGFSNYVAYVPLTKIQTLEIKRNPFQSMSNTANLKVYIYSQRGSNFLIKHLKFEELKTLLKMLKI